MKLAIGHAYNGEHRAYNKYAKELGINSHLFVIDSANWLDNLMKADAYIWHADTKEQNYRQIHDRIYFLEFILKKKVFPDMNMYFAYADKIKENDIFKLLKVPIPKTFLTYKKEGAISFAERAKYPFIVKDAHGYGGHHVHKVENKKEALKMIEQIFSEKGMYHHLAIMKGYFLAQEYIEIDKDLRVIVIGDKVACAYWRKSEGWKNNVAHGAEISFSDIPKKALKLCLDFNKKMGFHWMSYDVFIDKKGNPLMNEFSCNFGIKGAENGGYNIRKMQVEYVKNYLKKLKKPRFRQGFSEQGKK